MSEEDSFVIAVQQVDFVSVPTRDAAAAQRFYRDVLGLPPSAGTPGEVEAPNVTFSFWEPEAEGLAFEALHRRYAPPGSTRPLS